MHPSQFPKRADGTRFWIRATSGIFQIMSQDDAIVAMCTAPEHAEMVAAALEFQARDGETFVLEDGKCKPT